MTKRILLTEPIQQSGMELLRERADVVLAEDASPQALRALIRDADGLIARNTEVSPCPLPRSHTRAPGRSGQPAISSSVSFTGFGPMIFDIQSSPSYFLLSI